MSLPLTLISVSAAELFVIPPASTVSLETINGEKLRNRFSSLTARRVDTNFTSARSVTELVIPLKNPDLFLICVIFYSSSSSSLNAGTSQGLCGLITEVISEASVHLTNGSVFLQIPGGSPQTWASSPASSAPASTERWGSTSPASSPWSWTS